MLIEVRAPKGRFAGIAPLAALLLCALPARAEQQFGPFGAPANPVTSEARPEARARRPDSPPPSHIFWVSFLFYSRVVSPTHDARCSHRPTCSGYAIGAVGRYGMPLGGWMAIDRLMMGSMSSAIRFLPMVHTPAGARFLHPMDDALTWRLGLDLHDEE